MTSVKEISMKLDKIKKREENKKCFDCGEKGTTYVCIDFGTFICSRCAGILRELNFKVKAQEYLYLIKKKQTYQKKMGMMLLIKYGWRSIKKAKTKSRIIKTMMN